MIEQDFSDKERSILARNFFGVLPKIALNRHRFCQMPGRLWVGIR
jgi:hypothetical protein